MKVSANQICWISHLEKLVHHKKLIFTSGVSNELMLLCSEFLATMVLPNFRYIHFGHGYSNLTHHQVSSYRGLPDMIDPAKDTKYASCYSAWLDDLLSHGPPCLPEVSATSSYTLLNLASMSSIMFLIFCPAFSFLLCKSSVSVVFLRCFICSICALYRVSSKSWLATRTVAEVLVSECFCWRTWINPSLSAHPLQRVCTRCAGSRMPSLSVNLECSR